MFPWLPFLSFDANSRRPGARRPRKRRGVRPRSSLDSVWLRVDCGDGLQEGDVQVEYPRLPFRPLTATETIGSENSSEIGFVSPATTTDRPDSAPLGDVVPPPAQPTAKRKARIAAPQAERTGSRSPRSASNSRQRTGGRGCSKPRRRCSSSSAGRPRPPPPSPAASTLNAALASTAVYEGAVASTSNEQPATITTTAEVKTTVSEVELPPETAAAPHFQRIPSPPPVASGANRPHFGRTNALLREGVLRTEWEPITTSGTATSSSFQSVPDHDATYTNARHRGNWESGVASFDLVTQQTRRDYTPPRANGAADCPAEIVLRQRAEAAGGPWRDPKRASTAPAEAQLNGSALSNRRARPHREGVAELLGGLCSQRPADAAGEGSGGGAPHRPQANGRAEGAAKTDRNEERRSPPPSASRQSPQNDENREPVGFPPAVKDTQPVESNGRSQLNGLKSKDAVELKLRPTEEAAGRTRVPLLIRGASIVNDDAIFVSDVLVADGVIRQILPGLEAPEGAETIDASGRWLLPAGIDVHTEIAAVGEDLQNATNSALSGGTTTIVNLIQVDSNESLTAAVERSRALIERYGNCGVALSVPLASWSEATKAEVERLIADGITSFVLELRNDAELFEAMNALKKLGALPAALPENRDLVALLERQFGSLSAEGDARPPHLEGDTIHRLSTIAQLTNSPLALLSIGSAEACRAVQAGRQRGALVYAQIPIAAVAPEARSSTAPQSRIPIRGGQDDVREAIELLANGPLSLCTSDHSTVRNAPGKPQVGTISAADRLALLWEKGVTAGRLDLMRFVAVTSANPAKFLGVYPKKGRIAVGADADVVVWNAKASRTLGGSRSGGERSTFEGQTVHAVPELTIIAGRIAVRNGAPTDDRIPPNPPHIFSVVQLRDRTVDLGKPDDIATAAPPAVRKDSAASNGSGGNERPQSRDRGEQADRLSIESTAFLSAAQPPAPSRSTTKVIHPPGGRSTGLW
ncbi:hypothetical protein M3Y99_00550000 [Aphelenchoides fujianensis]|nr:hypothetical protein M3Y99_00550000 [Aphelenchoides fujianensis]